VVAHVHLQSLLSSLHATEEAAQATPLSVYLRQNAPPLQVDRWGDPLPLSAVEQDRLDRMWAILAAPRERGRALIVSGALAPDEVDALQAVYPDVWSELAGQAYREMIATPPPYPGWVEATLDVLFGVPASQVYTKGPPAPRQQLNDQSKLTGGPSALGTPSDRRETAVRQGVDQ